MAKPGGKRQRRHRWRSKKGGGWPCPECHQHSPPHKMDCSVGRWSKQDNQPKRSESEPKEGMQ